MRSMMVVLWLSLAVPAAAFTDLKQPIAARKPVAGHYHDTQVVDPYQWLEAIDAPLVRTWALEQDAYARQFCKGAPDRDALRARLKAVNQVAQVGAATLMGNRLFFAKYCPGRGMLGVWMQEGDGAAVQLPLPIGAGETKSSKAFGRAQTGILWLFGSGRRLGVGLACAFGRWLSATCCPKPYMASIRAHPRYIGRPTIPPFSMSVTACPKAVVS